MAPKTIALYKYNKYIKYELDRIVKGVGVLKGSKLSLGGLISGVKDVGYKEFHSVLEPLDRTLDKLSDEYKRGYYKFLLSHMASDDSVVNGFLTKCNLDDDYDLEDVVKEVEFLLVNKIEFEGEFVTFKIPEVEMTTANDMANDMVASKVLTKDKTIALKDSIKTNTTTVSDSSVKRNNDDNKIDHSGFAIFLTVVVIAVAAGVLYLNKSNDKNRINDKKDTSGSHGKKDVKKSHSSYLVIAFDESYDAVPDEGMSAAEVIDALFKVSHFKGCDEAKCREIRSALQTDPGERLVIGFEAPEAVVASITQNSIGFRTRKELAPVIEKAIHGGSLWHGYATLDELDAFEMTPRERS